MKDMLLLLTLFTLLTSCNQDPRIKSMKTYSDVTSEDNFYSFEEGNLWVVRDSGSDENWIFQCKDDFCYRIGTIISKHHLIEARLVSFRMARVSFGTHEYIVDEGRSPFKVERIYGSHHPDSEYLLLSGNGYLLLVDAQYEKYYLGQTDEIVESSIQMDGDCFSWETTRSVLRYTYFDGKERPSLGIMPMDSVLGVYGRYVTFPDGVLDIKTNKRTFVTNKVSERMIEPFQRHGRGIFRDDSGRTFLVDPEGVLQQQVFPCKSRKGGPLSGAYCDSSETVAYTTRPVIF